MGCTSCNNNAPVNGKSMHSRNPQMYRSSQLARNNQMYRNGNMNRNTRQISREASNDCGCKMEQSEDYRHPSCECSKDSCNQATAPVDSMMLAMAYVPWQQWEEIFDYEKALCIGTIFVNLDKPWTGRACDS